MPDAEPRGRAPTLAELERRLSRLGAAVPLVALRLPALERTAWQAGLRAARALERRAGGAFVRAARAMLRGADRVAHDRGSDLFVAALVAPARAGVRSLAPVDVRSAQARFAARLGELTGLDVDAGWTEFAPGRDALAGAVARAVQRGSLERERYGFFSTLGHELRTPLASIRGYLETLAHGDVAPADRARFIGIAYAETLRVTRLLEGLFEISLLDLSSGVRPAAPARLDAALTAVATASAAAARLRAVHVEFADPGPVLVAIDGEQLVLALLNLVENAIKHGRPGGRVAVAVLPGDPRFVRVAVDDDGPGIPLGDRTRLFDLGVRGATGARGSGIGLALVRLLLERAGGDVAVADAPLGGARLTVALPRVAEREVMTSARIASG